MSYDAIEISRQGGAPLELYQFFQGSLAHPDTLVPPAAPSGVLVYEEPWEYAATADVYDPPETAPWPAFNPSSLVGGTPGGGTAGTFSMNDLQHIGALGTGSGRVWHEHLLSELDPTCRYIYKTTITRSRLTGWFVNGLGAEGLDTPFSYGGGLGPSEHWVAPFPKADGTLRIFFGLFIVEWRGFSDDPLDLTVGSIRVERICPLDVGFPETSGPAVAYNFTSADVTVVYRGETYVPAIIIRGPFRFSDDESRAMDAVIEVPRDHPIVDVAGRPAPAPPVRCTIHRVHRGDLTDGITPLMTQVTRVEKLGARARLTLTPVTALFEKSLPLEVVQKKCQNQLYGPVCQASRVGHQFPDLEVTAVDGRDITIAGLGVLAGVHTTRFTEGVLTGPDGSESDIETFDAASEAPDVVRLHKVNPAVQVGSIVMLTDGCLKDVGTCETLHDNLVHHRGEPVMPTRNPGTGAGLN